MFQSKKLQSICISCVLFVIAAGLFVSFLFGRTMHGALAIELQSFEFFKQLFSPALPPVGSPQIDESPGAPAPSALSGALAYEAQIVSVVERANPSVVSIIVTKDLPVIEQYFINPFEDFDRFGFPSFEFRVPQYRQKGTEKREVGGGTGFVVSEDGMVLTNNHVVSDADAEYTVLFNDGSKASAKVIGRDPVFDLAVIKVAKTGLSPLALGDSSALAIGQTAIAIGNALGEFRNTVSVGVISGLGRTVTAEGGGRSEVLRNVIQTDAAINRGNSGGPLLNLRGEVIGINTAIVVGAENIGFAVPINFAKKIISDVRTTGKISVPFLGVRYRMIADGALLVSDEKNPAVVPGSPADKAGLKKGDIIAEMNGERITHENPLALVLRNYRAGDTVTLKVIRDKDEITVNATLSELK